MAGLVNDVPAASDAAAARGVPLLCASSWQRTAWIGSIAMASACATQAMGTKKATTAASLDSHHHSHHRSHRNHRSHHSRPVQQVTVQPQLTGFLALPLA